jgi:hypothetical protein
MITPERVLESIRVIFNGERNPQQNLVQAVGSASAARS